MHRTTAPEDRRTADLEQAPRSRFAEVTVKLTLPRHLAALIERHGHELLAALAVCVQGVEAVQSAVQLQNSTTDYADRLEQRRREHARLAVQLYRRWRRCLPAKADHRQRRRVLVMLAQEVQLDPGYVGTLISRRRKVVQGYVHSRREALAARLYLDGLSDPLIASRLGCCRVTARRYWQAGVRRGGGGAPRS